jgi:hypothetical protein
MQREWAMTNSNLSAEPINDKLKRHAVALQDWHFADNVVVLHEWAVRFNKEFRLDLRTPAIGVERLRVELVGTYRPGRNGLGLRHEIVLNSLYLGRPLCQQLATLLHEVLHEWQALYGKRGRGNYHNRQFRIKARQFGLIVDQYGHNQRVEPGRFTQLLMAHGVDIEGLPTVGEADEAPVFRARPRGTSKLKKWSCACTNAWVATELHARCTYCGVEFERVS